MQRLHGLFIKDGVEKQRMRIFLFLAAALLLTVMLPVAGAQEAGTWSWSTYTGTTTWYVANVEDQGGCNGPVITNRYNGVTIDFRNGSAVLGDMGHGSVGGTFVSSNILHVDSRTVADPPGESTLSSYDVLFTGDCLNFVAKYTWDYSGPDTVGPCSGTTSLTGTNNAGSCPQVEQPLIPPTPPPSTQEVDRMITSARPDLDRALELMDLIEKQQAVVFEWQNRPDMADAVAQENTWIANERAELKTLQPKVEGEYAAIFVKDPNNFDANWDMAQFKKAEGQIPDFIRYVNNALGDEKTAAGKRDDLRHYVAGQMKTADVPTPESSPFVRQEGVDGDAVQSVYGYDITRQKEKDEGVNLFLFFTSGSLAEKAVRE